MEHVGFLIDELHRLSQPKIQPGYEAAMGACQKSLKKLGALDGAIRGHGVGICVPNLMNAHGVGYLHMAHSP